MKQYAPSLYVTNFNQNFTGVSATAAGVVHQQMQDIDLRLVGHPLPGCPDPITLPQAREMSRELPNGRPFSIWHVRRNPEMRAALWCRDILRRPIKIVFTSAAQRRHSMFPRWLISRMDAVIATTPKAAEFVPNVYATVPHGVDTKRFRPAPDRSVAWQQTGYPGQRGIATIGRIRPEKGTDLFIEAMLHILPQHSDVTALVIGRAEEKHKKFEQNLKSKIAEAGLSDRIIFTGEIAPDTLPDLMRALTLLVPLPRYEGYGMTPLEAMASAVPFVASDTGYFRDFSRNETAGLIVPTGDVGAATQAIDQMLDDEEKRSIQSKIALSIARSTYSIEREVAGIKSVYRALWKGQ